MATQELGQAPKLSSFGLADQGKEFPTEPEGAEASERKRQQERERGKGRTVAVSKRGPGNAKGQATELDDDQESDEGESLDASGDESESGDVQAREGEEGDGGDTGDDESGDDAGTGEKDGAEARKAGKEDNRTRKQLKRELLAQAGKNEALQRQIDQLNTRMNSAAAQRETRDEDEPDEDMDALLDLGKDDTELLSVGDQKKIAERKKKLSAHIGKVANKQVKAYHDGELEALYAIPAMKEVVDWAHGKGIMAKVTAGQTHPATKAAVLLLEKHKTDLEGLKVKHAQEIGKMKERLRQANLDEIPVGSGSRGTQGTGLGQNARPRNIVDRGYAEWKRKYAT